MVPRLERLLDTCKNHDQSMVDKKGYIKTLEAVIAIIIIVVVSYTLIPRSVESPPEIPPVVKGAQKIIDQTIQFNETLRNILTAEKDLPAYPPPSPFEQSDYFILKQGINDTIARNIPPGYDYTCAVCSNPGTCLADTPIDKSVYMTDVLIASGNERQNPKIVRIWFWRKPTPDPNIIKVCKKDPALGTTYNNCEMRYPRCYE